MDQSKQHFWRSFLLAIETEPREAQEIRGASGFVHPALAVGVDRKRGRTVIVSGDPDARTAALAQADIQAAVPSMKIVMARPVGINLQAIALALMQRIGSARLSLSLFTQFKGVKGKKKGEEFIKDVFGNHAEAASRPFKYVELNTVSFWKELIQQVSFLEVEGFGVGDLGVKVTPTLILERLLAFDPVAIDRIGGVCAVPLYDLGELDFEMFARGETDEVREILRRHHIFQYFFPPADQIALAAADRGLLTSTASILNQVSFAPEIGHPLAPNEIVDPRADLLELVDALQEKGLLVEGSASIEVSQSGQAVRAEVKFQPREGVMAKISRVLAIKLDVSLKDIFK